MCYEYIDSRYKFNEISSSPKEKFFSQLNNKEISVGNYKHAQKVYRTHNTKILGEYNCDYNMNDIIQLIDVEENFTITIHERFKLDLSSSVTLSSLLWEAAVKTIRKELELLTNDNIVLFYERSIRGEITRAIRYYTEPNDKCMYDYDVSEKRTFILNLHFNNINGYAFSKPLPYGGFEFVE